MGPDNFKALFQKSELLNLSLRRLENRGLSEHYSNYDWGHHKDSLVNFLPDLFQAEVEETLKRIQSHKGVIGTMVVNAEGKHLTGCLLDRQKPTKSLFVV